MKKILLAGCLIYCTACFAIVPSMNKLRVLYQKAVTDEKACKELMGLILPHDGKNTALLMGYKASGTMMMATHVLNPFTKMSYFKKGKQMLEKAILEDPENIELRFLRFNGQTNTPSFLGYHDHIENDKQFLLSSLSSISDSTLKGFVITALSKSKYVTANEKQRIKKSIK